MKAILYRERGGYERLEHVDLQGPERRAGEVLVRVIAAGVNPGDDMLRRFGFPGASLPMVPGFEGAGVVVERGESSLAVGQRVMFTGPFGVTEDGTWRELMAIGPERCLPVPEALGDVEAAGFPIAYTTAFLALRAGGFAPGKRVLALAVGGGVGNAAVQVAAALGAETVLTTAGSAAKAARARELGYGGVIDLSRESLRARALELTAGRGVDLVVDGVGGALTAEAVTALAPRGTHVIYGAAAGMQTSLNVMDLVMKGASLVGFAALVAQPPEVVRAAFEAVAELAAQRRVRPVVARVFPLAEAAAAQRFLAEGRPFGKVILTP